MPASPGGSGSRGPQILAGSCVLGGAGVVLRAAGDRRWSGYSNSTRNPMTSRNNPTIRSGFRPTRRPRAGSQTWGATTNERGGLAMGGWPAGKGAAASRRTRNARSGCPAARPRGVRKTAAAASGGSGTAGGLTPTCRPTATRSTGDHRRSRGSYEPESAPRSRLSWPHIGALSVGRTLGRAYADRTPRRTLRVLLGRILRCASRN